MSVENTILSEKQREIVNGEIKSLCTPGACQWRARFDCAIGRLVNDKLPFCYTDKDKRNSLRARVEESANEAGIEAEMIPPTLGFLEEARIVTRSELRELQSRQPTFKEIMERKRAAEATK